MTEFIHNSWQKLLAEEFQKPYYLQLHEFLKKEYQEQTIYPSMYHIYEALQRTPYETVKVVILGQDPYHGINQAHGLSFSVQKGVTIPPSLKNIYKELHDDIGCPIPTSGDLSEWADQGVLLLNTVLTVRAGQANSHKGKGWEQLTNAIIQKLNQREEPVIFILWGSQAQKKKEQIDCSKHIVIESVHPSPLSAYRGFFGSRPFSKVNDALLALGKQPIDWSVHE